MNERIGTMSPALVWAFALGAILIGMGGAYATSAMGATVSSAVYFGVFLIAGFLATLMTRARALLAAGVFVLASLASAGAYYVLAANTVSEATTALGGGEAASTMGAFVGIFVAIVTLVVTLVAGLSGVVAGSRARSKMLAA